MSNHMETLEQSSLHCADSFEILPPSLRGYDVLTQPLEIDPSTAEVSFVPNASYEHYLSMPKVMVGRAGAEQLQDIYENLRTESMPRYLSAAGWAATEAAMVQPELPVDDRLRLLDGASECWQRSITRQRQLNGGRLDCLIEDTLPYRTALDIAILPLVRGVIEGDLSAATRRAVYRNCLNIAQLNAVQLNLAARNEDYEALADHIGFGYECNALLAFNWRCSKGWFVIPSVARSDSGYYHGDQTHDLSVIHHRKGRLLNVTPVEIKAAASVKDRRRYKALLVRGKMHLSVEGGHAPGATLRVLSAVFEGQPTQRDIDTAVTVTDRFVDMVRDYYASPLLGGIATRSVTGFRDSTQVRANHPGLLIPA